MRTAENGQFERIRYKEAAKNSGRDDKILYRSDFAQQRCIVNTRLEGSSKSRAVDVDWRTSECSGRRQVQGLGGGCKSTPRLSTR